MNVIPLLFKRLLAPSQTRIGGNRCLRYRLVFAGAVLWTGSASAANVHSYCATTSAELQGALDAAASFSAVGDSTIVSLVPGTTYKTTALATPQPFRYSSTGTTGYLWLSGDARYPCANASDTSFPLLDGDHTTPVLVAARDAVGDHRQSPDHPERREHETRSGIEPEYQTGDKGAFNIYGNIIRRNHTTASLGGVWIVDQSPSGNNDFFANVIIKNSADAGYGAGGVSGNGYLTLLSQNTVADNKTSLVGGPGGMSFESNAARTLFVFNSIFWGNDNFDLSLNSDKEITLDYCDYGTRDGYLPYYEDGRLQLDPQFVDPSAGNFRLQGTSPALGVSPDALTGSDVEGNLLPNGGLVDLGAYTRTIFKDGFETLN